MNGKKLFSLLYWRVKVTEDISADGEIFLMAHRVDVLPDGSVSFTKDEGNNPENENDATYQVLIVAPGKWKSVNAATIFDGGPVGLVEYWKGYLTVGTKQDEIDQELERLSKGNGNGSKYPERNKMTQTLRYSVLERDGFVCKKCGHGNEDGARLEVDHIIPVSKGGKTELSNLETLCKDCNRGKRDKISQAKQ